MYTVLYKDYTKL